MIGFDKTAEITELTTESDQIPARSAQLKKELCVLNGALAKLTFRTDSMTEQADAEAGYGVAKVAQHLMVSLYRLVLPALPRVSAVFCAMLPVSMMGSSEISWMTRVILFLMLISWMRNNPNCIWMIAKLVCLAMDKPNLKA